MKDKVLVLSCGTGGGHNSAAMAVTEELNSRGIEANFMEYLEITNPKIKNNVNKLYISSTNYNGKVFKKIYKLGELYQKTKLKSPVYRLNWINRNKLYKYIKENNYSYVVTSHLFAAECLTAIKKEHDIHFVAIATDYVSIPFWEETNPDYLVIPNKELEEDFISKGIKQEKLLPLGIPVSNVYSEEYNIEDSKKELDLKKQEKYVLILTGSMGFGNVLKEVEILVEKIKDVNFIVSCGKNKKLLEKIQEKFNSNSKVIALPFTRNINLYMKAADIILSKPGGLTSTEIATLRKPFIHTMPIPGCENYNANFFSSKKMSIKCNSIEEIVENTKKLLKDKKLQEELIKNQEKYIDKNACKKIVDKIIEEIRKYN